MSKVQSITGQPTAPKTFAGILVEHGDEIQHIACVIQWKSGETTVNNTQVTLGEAAWLDYVFRRDFMQMLEAADDS